MFVARGDSTTAQDKHRVNPNLDLEMAFGEVNIHVCCWWYLDVVTVVNDDIAGLSIAPY